MRAFGAIAFALLAGCGGSEETSVATFPATPLEVIETDTGALVIEVRTAPEQPPTRGMTEVELLAHDAEGSAAAGLSITPEVWMPVHGHAASTRPAVVETEAGRYLVSDVDLFMPGRWELRLELDGPVSDSAVVPLTVE